jgi:hypothetical protein
MQTLRVLSTLGHLESTIQFLPFNPPLHISNEDFHCHMLTRGLILTSSSIVDFFQQQIKRQRLAPKQGTYPAQWHGNALVTLGRTEEGWLEIVRQSKLKTHPCAFTRLQRLTSFAIKHIVYSLVEIVGPYLHQSPLFHFLDQKDDSPPLQQVLFNHCFSVLRVLRYRFQ